MEQISGTHRSIEISSVEELRSATKAGEKLLDTFCDFASKSYPVGGSKGGQTAPVCHATGDEQPERMATADVVGLAVQREVLYNYYIKPRS